MKNVRKMLIAGIVALTATVGVGATQASAATSTTACFKWGPGTPAAGTPYMNRAVQLFQTNSVGTPTAKLRDGRTGSNGCATFYNTPSGVYLRMRAIHIDQIMGGNDLYVGWTSRIANPGQGGALLGLANVYYIG